MFGMRGRETAGTPAGISSLVQRARQDGHRAGRSGKYDEWSLTESGVVPYLTSLEHRKDHALARLDIEELNAEGERLQRRLRIRTEAATAAEEVAAAQDDLADARRYMDACNAQMDRIAIREARIHDELRARRGPRRWGRRREEEEAPPPNMPPGYAYESAAQIDDSWRESRWEGPHSTRRMPAWVRIAALVVIALVEAPLQWRVFHYLEPQFWLSVLFTIPVSVVMVFVPHFCGVWYRGRDATGADGLNRVLPLAMLVPWALTAVILGDLRRRVLLVPHVDYLHPERRIHTQIERLHPNAITVSVMFVALLLLTGALAFMLGISDDHPLVAAYRGAAAQRGRIMERLRDDRGTLAGARQRVEAFTEERDNDAQRTDRRREAIEHAYAAAAAEYLDAVTQEVASPSLTEAVTRFPDPNAAGGPASASRGGPR